MLGVLSGENPFLAVVAMAVVGAAAGYCFAVSLRFAIFGLSVALSLLIAQGLPLDPADALPALDPATILFVLRPEEDETFHRPILRAIGTAAGLVVATALAEWLRGDRDRHRHRRPRLPALAQPALYSQPTCLKRR